MLSVPCVCLSRRVITTPVQVEACSRKKQKSMPMGRAGASVPRSSPRLLLKTSCSVCVADVSPVRTDAAGAAAAAG